MQLFTIKVTMSVIPGKYLLKRSLSRISVMPVWPLWASLTNFLCNPRGMTTRGTSELGLSRCSKPSSTYKYLNHRSIWLVLTGNPRFSSLRGFLPLTINFINWDKGRSFLSYYFLHYIHLLYLGRLRSYQAHRGHQVVLATLSWEANNSPLYEGWLDCAESQVWKRPFNACQYSYYLPRFCLRRGDRGSRPCP